jgi:AcrR family transcriptional regulator
MFMKKQSLRTTREEILDLSVPLFAALGFDRVSMRDIAAAAGVTPAALYHHFADKEQLCQEVVAYAFQEKVESLQAIVDGEGSPWDRLELVVVQFTRILAQEQNFRRLMQWVLLDSHERRVQSLVDCVFRDLFRVLYQLAGELDPDRDAHQQVVSIVGLVIYPFETQAVRRFLPGYQPQHEDPAVIARHIVGLLRNGLGASRE